MTFNSTPPLLYSSDACLSLLPPLLFKPPQRVGGGGGWWPCPDGSWQHVPLPLISPSICYGSAETRRGPTEALIGSMRIITHVTQNTPHPWYPWDYKNTSLGMLVRVCQILFIQLPVKVCGKKHSFTFNTGNDMNFSLINFWRRIIWDLWSTVLSCLKCKNFMWTATKLINNAKVDKKHFIPI